MSVSEIISKQCVALDAIKGTSKGSENKHQGSGAAVLMGTHLGCLLSRHFGPLG